MTPDGLHSRIFALAGIVALMGLPGCGNDTPAEGSIDSGGSAVVDAVGGGDGAVQSDVTLDTQTKADAGAGCVEGLPCDDGDPCTVDATCKGGVCVPGQASFCECSATADCAAKEDGDLCNGTLYCDTGNFPYRYVVNPATVPT